MPGEAIGSKPRLRLASHVRACVSEGQVIFLDLRNSRYMAVGSDGAAALNEAIEGWPLPFAPTAGHGDQRSAATFTAQLVAKGLVVEDKARDRSVMTYPKATGSVDRQSLDRALQVKPTSVLHFLTSAVVAATWLRFWSLERIADAMRRHRQRHCVPAPPSTVDALQTAIATYDKLRPFAFTAHDKCLQDSLAMAHFLASEGFAADWLIGVKTNPFAAHSWVQRNGVVLNDQHEYVCRFCPILVA